MFLTIEDYKSVCTERELEVLSQNDDKIRLNAERIALEETSSYLRSRYDVDKIFSAKQEDRNAILVQVCVDISLFYLVASLPAKMASETRKNMYDKSIKWLEKVQKGKVSPDLPLVKNENNAGSYPFKIGGMQKQKYDW